MTYRNHKIKVILSGLSYLLSRK